MEPQQIQSAQHAPILPTPQVPLASPSIEPVGAKRKRSSSVEISNQSTHAPPSKTIKTHSNNPNVNYLARQYTDTLSLIDQRDSLRTTLNLLNEYLAVVERHESLASNLGAKALGPMLMKRFERLFDEQPRILKSNSKDNAPVTWLDVVEFARHKPEQFNLEKQRDGVKVCQFYTKQCRVEISEEDFLLISSGMPQKLIPPQPIPEDEEKELATIEILEKSIASVSVLAEQVQSKIRTFKARMTARKNAIVGRRQQDVAVDRHQSVEPETPTSPTSGFVAVNKQSSVTNGISNGSKPSITANPSIRSELELLFTNVREGVLEGSPPLAPRTFAPGKQKIKSGTDDSGLNVQPVAIPNTPQNLVNHQRPSQVDRADDSGPFKAEMLSRMEQLNRGDRVLPPCDRCRRLHMDCLKNLTACQGCTRKHAKCSWKEVTDRELADNPRPNPSESTGGVNSIVQPEGPPQPVRDEELLGEDDSDDEAGAPTLPKMEPTAETPMTLNEESLPPPSSSRIDSSPAREVQIVHQSQDEIAARAREILNHRMVEVPSSIPAGPGFPDTNPYQMSTEVRIHEPTIIPSIESVKADQRHIYGGSDSPTLPPQPFTQTTGTAGNSHHS